MQGDFSRIRFNRGKNYTAVLEQQGRVALDADANEQRFIDEYQSRTQIIDAVGQYGGPAGDAGFHITVPSGNEMTIGPGRYYVNGLLCENPGLLSYDVQPYLADPGQTAATLLGELAQSSQNSVLQVYLELWQQLATALDDPSLREPALGQADTTARLQTVWRVVADLVTPSQAPSGQASPMSPCCQGMYAAPAPTPSTGTMDVGLSGPAAGCGCGPVATAGYQGIENQLYRVEIHQGGPQSQATFKWSRENGSVVTAITKVAGSTVWVSSPNPDTNLGFQPGQWVELTDDTLEYGRPPKAPGTLYQILRPNPADPDVSFVLDVPANQTLTVNPALNARMRRWDMSGPAVTSAGIPLSPGSPIPLENGIQVTFDPGTFSSGDYWTIPARTATGQIEWPPFGGENPAHPTSIQVYRAPLACIHATVTTVTSGRTTTETVTYQPDDCRQKFSPLTTFASPTAIEAAHVTSISWVNDDVVTLDALITNGLTITLDQPPASVCPISGANVIVTVELADAAAVHNLNEPQNPGNRGTLAPPATNLRTVMVIDGPVTSNGSAITWQLPPFPGEAQGIAQGFLIENLSTYLYQGAPAQQWAKVRIRLLGQMIYATGAAGLMYLDGQALGQPGVRSDGKTPRINLKFPSGVGLPASDFEGWLYVAPILQTNSIVISPGAVTVTGVVTNTSPPAPVAPTAEIVMSYPPLTDTPVTITLTSSTPGVGTIVSVPGTVTIPAGQSSFTFPINVVDNPGANTTLDFTISATVGVKFGAAIFVNGSFAVTGVAPPPFLGGPIVHPVIG